MPLNRFLTIDFNFEPLDQYPQYPQNSVEGICGGGFGDIEDIEHRVENENQGAATPLSFDPLPGQFWLDPVLNGFMPNYKVMAGLSECRGYPQACPRCRLLMVSGECLFGPGCDA